MNVRHAVIAMFGLTLVGTPPLLADHHGGAEGPVHAATIDASGRTLGRVTVSQTVAGVLIDLDLKDLPPGEHALHIHEKGACEVAGGFASAGGHFAPVSKVHGFTMEGGAHAGDMPNQFVSDDGRLRAQVLNGQASLGQGDASLADEDGSALVIHEKADDYASQPSGAAGGRIACAVIFPPRN